MSSSLTSYSTPESEGPSTSTHSVSARTIKEPQSYQNEHNQKSESGFEVSDENTETIVESTKLSTKKYECSSSSESKTKTAQKKTVKMWQLTFSESTTSDVPKEEGIIYKLENSLITLEEASRQQAEELAKKMDLRPGVKVLSFIPSGCLQYVIHVPETNLWTPVKIDLSHLDVQELSILKSFPYTQILDLTGNKLRVDNMSFLQYLPRLQALTLDDNRLYTCDLPSINLAYLSMRKNRLVWMDPFTYPNLQYFNLDGNRIKMIHNLDDEFCPNLVKVSAAENRIRTTLSQWSCSIRYIYLNNCKIRKVEGMENLVNLSTLHLRGNRIKKLLGFTWHLQRLSYLNLRDNKISNVRQFKRLRPLPKLKVLITSGNPFEEVKEEEKVRWDLIYAYKKLVRINKKLVSPQEVENSDLGKNDIDNDDDSSDDAIAEDSEEEEEGPPIEWDDDDDPESENFDPFRTHAQMKRYVKRPKTPLLDDSITECNKERGKYRKEYWKESKEQVEEEITEGSEAAKSEEETGASGQ